MKQKQYLKPLQPIYEKLILDCPQAKNQRGLQTQNQLSLHSGRNRSFTGHIFISDLNGLWVGLYKCSAGVRQSINMDHNKPLSNNTKNGMSIQTFASPAAAYSPAHDFNVWTGNNVLPHLFENMLSHPQLVNKAVKATERIYNELKALGKSATEAQIGAVFNTWKYSFENNADY